MREVRWVEVREHPCGRPLAGAIAEEKFTGRYKGRGHERDYHQAVDWAETFVEGRQLHLFLAWLHQRAEHVITQEWYAVRAVSRSPGRLTRSEPEIPSWLWPQAAWLNSTPRFSARFSAGVIQSSAW